jgi:hypothetical protein
MALIGLKLPWTLPQSGIDPNGVHVFAQKNQLNWVKQRILKITERQATGRRFQKARKYVKYSRIPACVGFYDFPLVFPGMVIYCRYASSI